MRNSARIRVMFAVALPEPFTVLNVMQKSFSIIASFCINLRLQNEMCYSKADLGTFFSRWLARSICSVSKAKPSE